MFSSKKISGVITTICIGAALVLTPMIAHAKKVHIRVQAIIGTQTTKVKMLKDFMSDVTALTGGEVTFEVLPAGAVVGVKETLDAVDAGLIEGGFAWTHYRTNTHPSFDKA
jgi:TRAP-type C4-dicarboxylate transport system substrate-binding protein